MTLSFVMLDGTCLAAEKLRFGRECPQNNVEKHILIFESGCVLIQNMSEAQPKHNRSATEAKPKLSIITMR